MPWVLDASAALAVILDEPYVSSLAQALREGALLPAANLVEVVARLDVEDLAYDIDGILDELHVVVVPLLEEQAKVAGHLRQLTSSLGLSLADRACLATAAAFGATALTTDRAWLELPSPWRERIECVRPA